jgi:hypothetical protein
MFKVNYQHPNNILEIIGSSILMIKLILNSLNPQFYELGMFPFPRENININFTRIMGAMAGIVVAATDKMTNGAVRSIENVAIVTTASASLLRELNRTPPTIDTAIEVNFTRNNITETTSSIIENESVFDYENLHYPKEKPSGDPDK